MKKLSLLILTSFVFTIPAFSTEAAKSHNRQGVTALKPEFLKVKNTTKLKDSVKGKQIILKSREAIGIEKLSMNSLHFKTRTVVLQKTAAGRDMPDFLLETNLSLPDKLQSVSTISGEFSSILKRTWNGENYKSIVVADVMGQTIVTDNTNREKEPMSQDVEGIIGKDKVAALNSVKKLDPKKIVLNDMWDNLFPLILAHPFEQNLDYNYIGQAPADDTKAANVVEVKPQNGKTYRLFFDPETNYLLTMTVTYQRSDAFFTGDVEMKYTFSDRELTNGLLIPKKIKVINTQTSPGKPPRNFYSNIDILELKVNADFEKDIFEIK